VTIDPSEVVAKHNLEASMLKLRRKSTWIDAVFRVQKTNLTKIKDLFAWRQPMPTYIKVRDSSCPIILYMYPKNTLGRLNR
jgi:hypothetical protein